MSSDLFFEIQQRLSTKRPGRLAYTRQAFRMLPRLDTPRILDIGCGSGEVTSNWRG
jgi:2-polyprenyl-3-methyl-5-hydroxy-6-metoxy-1,4-benzoquinol methylase